MTFPDITVDGVRQVAKVAVDLAVKEDAFSIAKGDVSTVVHVALSGNSGYDDPAANAVMD